MNINPPYGWFFRGALILWLDFPAAPRYDDARTIPPIWARKRSIIMPGLGTIITDAAIANLSYTGSVMIFCVGVNLIWGKKIKVANMLPTLLFAVIYALIF